MVHLHEMKQAVRQKPAGEYCRTELLRYRTLRQHYGDGAVTACALSWKAWFENYPVYIYPHDKIAGSRYGNYVLKPDPLELRRARAICGSYGQLSFWTNSDHYAPGYERFLQDGIGGTMARIERSLETHRDEPDKVEFLLAQKEVLTGFSTFVRRHSEAAREASQAVTDPECQKELVRWQKIWRM